MNNLKNAANAAAKTAAAASVAGAEAKASAAEAAFAPFAPAHPSAHNVTELASGHGHQLSKMRQIKNTLDGLIQSQGKCEPAAFMQKWYASNDGYEEFCHLSDIVSRWDGEEFVTHTDSKFRAGVRFGTQAATDNLTQDKYKSLYINDRIGLHDEQHTLLLKLTGLSNHVKGITKVKEARKHLNQQTDYY